MSMEALPWTRRVAVPWRGLEVALVLVALMGNHGPYFSSSRSGGSSREDGKKSEAGNSAP